MPFIPDSPDQIEATSGFVPDTESQTPSHWVDLGISPEQSPRNSIFSKIGGFLGDVSGVTGVAKGVGEATKIAKAGLTGKPLPAPSISPKRFAGSVAKLGATTIGGLVAAPANIAGRVALGAGLGATFGGGEALEKDKSLGGIAKEATMGGAIGGAVPLAIEGIKYAVKGIPKLLSYTSQTPEEVLQRQYDNPKLAIESLNKVKEIGQEGLLKNMQESTRGIRKALSEQYDEGSKVLVKLNIGKRIGFNESETKVLQKLSEQFGIDLPTTPNNLSVKEALALNKEINSLYSKRAIREGTEGVIVRKFKDLLGDRLSGFEGIKDFLKNYATEKEIYDGINQVVNAYNKKPIGINTALGRIRTLFHENKTASLSAIKDLELKTGIPFTDQAAALQILKKMPKGSLVHHFFEGLIKAAGGIVTSPRLAGLESRVAGRFARSSASIPLRTGVSEVTRRFLRSR